MMYGNLWLSECIHQDPGCCNPCMPHVFMYMCTRVCVYVCVWMYVCVYVVCMCVCEFECSIGGFLIA